MSTYIQWALYGKDTGGNPLPKETAHKLRDALDNEVTEWHGENPDGECIGQFLTTSNNGYASVTEIVGIFSKTVPDCMFCLECFDEDDFCYKNILFHGNDREEIDGHVIYDMPQRVFYAPPKQPELIIVLNGGSVSGVFAESDANMNVTIVDRDFTKLEGLSAEEVCDTAAWIEEKLCRCKNIRTIYGSASNF